MITIKDYLELKKIYSHLESEVEEQKRDNNGYSNMPINYLIEMKEALCRIINKLEEE
jgi:hypothetical protein